MGRTRKSQDNKLKSWKTAVYIRLSKEDGNEVSLSIKNQKELLLKYISETEEDMKLYDVYTDDGRTGTDSDRPALQRMLTDINDGKVNCVIVKDISRLSRNYAEAGMYLEQVFTEKQVRFISLSLPALDSYLRPEEISSIATAMQNVINDDFCRQTSIKIRGTFNVKRSNGQFIGAFAPYGYLKDPDDKYHLIVDNDTVDTVKDIFKRYLQGNSKIGIAKHLNSLGVPNPSMYKRSIGLNYNNPGDKRDGLWSSKSIDTILHNQMYVGDMVQGRGKVISYKVHKQVSVAEEEWFIVLNTHEPIISKEDFEKVKRLLSRDVKTTQNNTVHLFSGLLKCDDCHKGMHRSRIANKHVYYSCKTYKTQSKEACSKHSIREDRLINAVLDAINAQLMLITDIETVINSIEKAPTTQKRMASIDKAILSKETEISKLNRVRDELYMDWKNEDLSRDDYHRLKQIHDNKLLEFKDNLQALKSELDTIKHQLNTDTPFFVHYKKFSQMEALDRAIVLELIDTIYIKEGNAIEVKFLFDDQQKRILDLIELYQDQIPKQKIK